jgi:hypothetical protein
MDELKTAMRLDTVALEALRAINQVAFSTNSNGSKRKSQKTKK